MVDVKHNMAKMTPSASPHSSSVTTLKKSNSASMPPKNQKTLHGFFSRTPETNGGSPGLPKQPVASHSSHNAVGSSRRPANFEPSLNLTPAPSSDDPDFDVHHLDTTEESAKLSTGLISPVTPANGAIEEQTLNDAGTVTVFGTPSRKVSGSVSTKGAYAYCHPL